ncbi:10996_t:CDS:1, partial [Acaulospora colombiana]
MTSSQQKQILVNVENEVVTITLNRPERGNSLNSSMVFELLDAFNSAIVEKSIRVIVLTGAGKFFCTGLDLKIGNKSIEEASEIFEVGLRLYQTIKECPKPVIARINGPALGGGIGLIFTTDLRIAVSDAYFSFLEVKRGLIPAIISLYIVPEIGTFKAKQYMLSGEKVTVDQAVSDKFLTCVVKNLKCLDDKVAQYAEELLSSAPGAMGTIKKLTNVIGSSSTDELKKQHVKQTFLEMLDSEEAAYGMSSFGQKKKPDWS